MPADIYIITTNTGSFSLTAGATYAGGVAPVAGDNVYFVNAPSGFLLDTGVTNALLLNRIWHYNTFRGAFGGTGNTPVQWAAPDIRVGLPPPDGSVGGGVSSWKQDVGTNQVTANVLGSVLVGTYTPQPPVQFQGCNSANVMNVLGGVVGIGTLAPGQAARWPTVNVAGGRLELGSGVSWTNGANDGGTLVLNSGGPTCAVTNYAGVLVTQGTFSINTIDNRSQATINHRSGSGTDVTNVKLLDGAMDISGNPSGFSTTNTTVRDGSINTFSPTQFTPGVVTIDQNGKNKFGGSTE